MLSEANDGTNDEAAPFKEKEKSENGLTERKSTFFTINNLLLLQGVLYIIVGGFFTVFPQFWEIIPPQNKYEINELNLIRGIAIIIIYIGFIYLINSRIDLFYKIISKLHKNKTDLQNLVLYKQNIFFHYISIVARIIVVPFICILLIFVIRQEIVTKLAIFFIIVDPLLSIVFYFLLRT